MAPALAAAFLVYLTVLAGGSGAAAQSASPPVPQQEAEAADRTLSPECRVPGSKLYTLAGLRGVKTALKDHRAVRVLALGSSSMASIGASSAQASYPARLAGELEKLFPNVAIEVVNRGLSGEVAGEAAERVRNTVAEVDPDLVVWQVGTNDALARVDLDTFTDALDETLKWLKSHEVDLVLVDPQYTASLARDEYYASVVKAIEDIARKGGVPLVRRFEAMRHLAAERKARGQRPGEGFRLNELGYRCMAEHVALAIAVSLLQPDPPPDSSSLDVSTTAKILPAK
jgi:lysophospholipase L1-like esterase